MYDWRLVNMAQEHCNDLLREAQQERLAKEALQGRESRVGAGFRAMLHLAHRLAASAERPSAWSDSGQSRPTRVWRLWLVSSSTK